MLTRQYEEIGILLAKSKAGRNPENPRFSWLLYAWNAQLRNGSEVFR
jgi:hypothetical protein